MNAVMSEIGEQEKIDIIVWGEEPVAYITNALSPTKVTKVIIDENAKRARVIVPEDQLSIAIGKGGQNVRLASKLSGYELDIEAERQKAPAVAEDEAPARETVAAPAQQAAPASQNSQPKAPYIQAQPKPVANAKAPAQNQAPAKQAVPKLKKKTELEHSLLEAIEEHGE